MEEKSKIINEILKKISANLSFSFDYKDGNVDADIKCDRANIRFNKDKSSDKTGINVSLDKQK